MVYIGNIGLPTVIEEATSHAGCILHIQEDASLRRTCLYTLCKPYTMASTRIVLAGVLDQRHCMTPPLPVLPKKSNARI